MPKGRKGRGASSGKGKVPRPAQANKDRAVAKVTLKGLRHQVKETRAKIEKGVRFGIKANRKARSHIKGKAKELTERLAQEARRRLDLEKNIADRNEELKTLELRLEALAKAEVAEPKKGKAEAAVGQMGRVRPVNINTSKDKRKKGVQAPADKREVKGYRDLLEQRLEAEDEELALVKEQLARLEERGRHLDEREDRLNAVEQQLTDGACSPDIEKGLKEMREGLEERLSILEQRSSKLDTLEAELSKMERFVDAKRTSLQGGKHVKKGACKGRAGPKNARRRRSEKEE